MVCSAALLTSTLLRRVTPVPRHPNAPGVALTRKAETPKRPNRLGVLLWHSRGEHRIRPRATHKTSCSSRPIRVRFTPIVLQNSH